MKIERKSQIVGVLTAALFLAATGTSFAGEMHSMGKEAKDAVKEMKGSAKDTANEMKGAAKEVKGESKGSKIARALKAAPPSIGSKATIAEMDGTVLRKGSNGWMCHPGTSLGAEDPMCNDEVWTGLLKALMAKSDFKADKVGISYMLKGDAAAVNNADPFDTERNEGEVWVKEGPHLMIAVPDPNSLEGMSTDPNNGGPYVMWKGTPYAHIMIPLGQKSK